MKQGNQPTCGVITTLWYFWYSNQTNVMWFLGWVGLILSLKETVIFLITVFLLYKISVSNTKFSFVIFAFNFAAQWATVILPSEIQQCLFPCFPCTLANLLNCILAYLVGQLQLVHWIVAPASPNNLGVFVWVLDVHVIVEVFHSCDMQNYYYYYSLLWALHRIN